MISIDGVHLERDLGLHLLADSEETMIPQVRQDSIAIPGRHGEIVFDSYLESRRLFPNVLIPSQATLADVQSILRKVSSLLLDEYGRPKDVKVIYDYEPDKYYVCRMNGYLSPERIARAGKFLIPLYANDPMAKSTFKSDEIRMDSGVSVISDILWDTGGSSRKITQPDKFTVINNGSLAVRYSYTIQGKGENVRLSVNGKTFSLGSFSNSTIRVDGDDYQVFVNNVYDLTKTSGDFIELMPGPNEITIRGFDMNLVLSDSFTYNYM